LFAQKGFEVPRPPAPPSVRAVPLDRAVLLEWGSDREAVNRTESLSNDDVYEFEGYTVAHDTRSSYPTEFKTFITYDRKNNVTSIEDLVYDPWSGQYKHMAVQQGVDRGVRRYILIDRDHNNSPLVNGTPYRFRVSAYNYVADETYSPRSLESFDIVEVTPGRPVKLDLTTATGDILQATHETGLATTRVTPVIVDPTMGTGDTYEVLFDTAGGIRIWSVRNRNTSSMGLSGQTNFTSLDDYMMIEGGILLIVKDEGSVPAGPNDVYSFTIPAPRSGSEVEKENLKRVGVFPNPVYLTSYERIDQGGGRKVTFINLPEKAVIRIYNLAGHLVRTVSKDSPSIFQEWDLTNDNRWLVASGMYVVHIEFTELGTSAVLKLGVIQGYPFE